MAAIGTRLLTLEIDGTAYTAQVSAVTIESAESDSDFITFADAASGGARDYTLNFTAVQDAASGTLWTEVFENSGDTVPFTVAPYGNAVPSASEPHFEGSAIISDPDGALLGGEADVSASARMTIECSWKCTAKPTKVTA